MRVDKVVGIKDAINGTEIELQADYFETSIYRVKVKEGVSEIVIPGTRFGRIVWAADFGLGGGVERAPFENTDCGEYVTFFFKKYNLAVEMNNVSTFLSQFEIVYDAFPNWFSTEGNFFGRTIAINSPDFQAPNGMFENCDHAPVFGGSTFKVAPKVYSAEAMKDFQYFPITSGWAPFKDCPNLERIENQGVFGDRLEGLIECDLSFKKPNGYDSLEAYPSGGSPRFIKDFVKADVIHFSERFPEFSAERLENSVNAFKINTIIVDNFGAPIFPFGGINYFEAPAMDKFYIDFNFDFIEDINENFVFGLGIFGITFPEICKDVRGLYKVFQFSYLRQEAVHVLTPDFLKDNFNSYWGDSVEEFLLENSERYTAELIPKVCAGLKRVDDYYYRKISGEWVNSFYIVQRNKIFLNGEKHIIEVQRLPATVEVVMKYAMNLYSHLIIEEDYFIPALPAGVRYIQDAYKRLFYNSIGPYQEITSPMETEPTILIAWSRSSHRSGISANAINIIANATAETEGEFMTLYDSVPGSLSEHTDSYTSEAIARPETYEDLIEFVKNSESSDLYYCVIQNNIVLEKNSLNSLEFCGGFQEDCFLGAAIDPRNIDALIPLNPSKSWANYRGALLVSLGFSGNGPVFWTGNLWEYRAEIDEVYTIRFFIAASHVFTEDVLEPYKIDINAIIMSGSPMTEDNSSTLYPYERTFSSAFEGDFEAFQNEHDIVLDDPGSITGGTGESYRDLSISGGKVGFNTTFIEVKDVNERNVYFHEFAVSYYPEGVARSQYYVDGNTGPQPVLKKLLRITWSDLKSGIAGYGYGEDFDLVIPPEDFYWDPFIVSFDALKNVPAGTTYSNIYTRTQWRNAMADIESYAPDPD